MAAEMMGTQSNKKVSRCTTESETDIHSFEIVGYSLKRGIGIGSFIQSDTFTVGGHGWTIRFYPDGVSKRTKKFSRISLELMTQDVEVQARYSFLLVNQVTGEPN